MTLGSLGLVGIGTPSASASTLQASGGTSCQALPVSFSYTEFTTGAAYETQGDSDGQTAFGGTAGLTNFSIAKNAALVAAAPNNFGFVAGGQVTGTNGVNVHNGNFYYDTGYTGVSVTSPGTFNAVSPANLPVQFAAAGTANTAFASELGALPTSAGDLISSTSSRLTLNAVGSGSNGDFVWNLSPGALSSVSSVVITGVPTGSSIIINVPDSGAVSVADLNVSIDGTSFASTTLSPVPALAASTIFNFYNATTLTLSGGWAGTLFAPNANMTFSNGHVYGTVVAASFASLATPAISESTYGPLDSALCVVTSTNALPQGRPILLIVTGGLLIGGAGLILRRRSGRAVSRGI
jgi:choice-of-anchor A domain-containing protein